MKKLYPFAVIAIMIQFASAQSSLDLEIGSVKPVGEKILKYPDQAFLINDTLLQYLDRATQLNVIYALTGYFFGTGWSGVTKISTESANHYDGIGATTVVEVLFIAAARMVVGTPDSIEARIYNSNADSAPDGLPVRTGKKSMADVVVSPESLMSPLFTSIPLTSGTGNISGPFLVSIEYGSINDTFGIMSNKVNSDGLGERRARIKFLGQQWQAARDVNPGVNCDIVLFPVVTATQGINELKLSDGIIIREPHPNPAGNFTNLSFKLNKGSDVSITVFDLIGKVYFETGKIHHDTGQYSVEVSTADMPPGTYYYSVVANGKSVISKFSVNR